VAELCPRRKGPQPPSTCELDEVRARSGRCWSRIQKVRLHHDRRPDSNPQIVLFGCLSRDSESARRPGKDELRGAGGCRDCFSDDLDLFQHCYSARGVKAAKPWLYCRGIVERIKLCRFSPTCACDACTLHRRAVVSRPAKLTTEGRPVTEPRCHAVTYSEPSGTRTHRRGLPQREHEVPGTRR